MLNKLSKKAGARLIIHNPNSPPLADEYGIDLQPNTASSVSIQQVIFIPIRILYYLPMIKNYLCIS